MTQPKINEFPVYLYIPNIIGYFRILFCALSYYFAMDEPVTSVVFYFLGQGMDAVDGYAARYFNQCSRFGAILDMLTDRMGTAVLFIVLSHLYKGTWGLAAFFIVLDLTSHWCQMYVALTHSQKSHKGSRNAILNVYYTNKAVLFIMCTGNEFFLMAYYLLFFYQTFALQLIAFICFPIFAGKQFLNIVQLCVNLQDLAVLDAIDAAAEGNKNK